MKEQSRWSNITLDRQPVQSSKHNLGNQRHSQITKLRRKDVVSKPNTNWEMENGPKAYGRMFCRRHPWLLAKSKRASGHAPLLGRQSVQHLALDSRRCWPGVEWSWGAAMAPASVSVDLQKAWLDEPHGKKKCKDDKQMYRAWISLEFLKDVSTLIYLNRFHRSLS